MKRDDEKKVMKKSVIIIAVNLILSIIAIAFLIGVQSEVVSAQEFTSIDQLTPGGEYTFDGHAGKIVGNRFGSTFVPYDGAIKSETITSSNINKLSGIGNSNVPPVTNTPGNTGPILSPGSIPAKSAVNAELLTNVNTMGVNTFNVAKQTVTIGGKTLEGVTSVTKAADGTFSLVGKGGTTLSRVTQDQLAGAGLETKGAITQATTGTKSGGFLSKMFSPTGGAMGLLKAAGWAATTYMVVGWIGKALIADGGML